MKERYFLSTAYIFAGWWSKKCFSTPPAKLWAIVSSYCLLALLTVLGLSVQVKVAQMSVYYTIFLEEKLHERDTRKQL